MPMEGGQGGIGFTAATAGAYKFTLTTNLWPATTFIILLPEYF
jgi:hypothetical protein